MLHLLWISEQFNASHASIVIYMCSMFQVTVDRLTCDLMAEGISVDRTTVWKTIWEMQYRFKKKYNRLHVMPWPDIVEWRAR